MKLVLHILITFIFFQSCSLKSVIIPNIPFLVADRMGDKLDLYYSEEKIVKKQITELIIKEKEIFNKLSLSIKNIKINKQLNLKNTFENTFEIINPFIIKFNIILSERISIFNKKRQKGFFQISNKDNIKIKKQIDSMDSEYIAEKFEFFLGELNRKQIGIISNNINVFIDLKKLRLKKRFNTQKRLKEAFELGKENRIDRINAIFNSQLNISNRISELEPLISFLEEFKSTINSAQLLELKSKKSLALEWLRGFNNEYK